MYFVLRLSRHEDEIHAIISKRNSDGTRFYTAQKVREKGSTALSNFSKWIGIPAL